MEGVLRELCNAFVRSKPQPSIPEMMRTYREIARLVPGVLEAAGTDNLFEARVFQDLYFLARAKAPFPVR